MAVLKRDLFLSFLNKKDHKNRLFLLFSESSLILQIFRKKVVEWIGGHGEALVFSFSGKDLDEKQFLNRCYELSMLSSPKLCVLHDAQQLKQSSLKNIIKEMSRNTNLPSTVVFEWIGEEKDVTSSPLYSFVNEHGICANLTTPKDKDFYPWMTLLLKTEGYNVTTEVVKILENLYGRNPDKIISEIKRYCSWKGNSTFISEQEILSYLSEDKDYNIFDLFNCLAQKQWDKYAKIAYKIAEDSDSSEIMIFLSLIYTFFSSYLNFLSGGSIPAYLTRYMKILEKNYTIEEVKKIIKLLGKIDMSIKGIHGKISPQDAFFVGLMELSSIARQNTEKYAYNKKR